MYKNIRNLAIWGISLASIALTNALPARAASVSPVGVNVTAFGTTTVFLTFLGLNNQVPAEAQWCGEVNANGSCVSGTIFGRLPQRSNLGRLSAQNNYTDIMTIPASVTRRAYQAAQRGSQGDFFYVRRFVSTTGGSDEFVVVTCRLAGGGARVPLSITHVEYKLANNQPVGAIGVGESLPRFGAQISFNGTGRLKGRWEVVLPGDPQPTQRDLLPEASLPLEERGLQQRYTQLERFDIFLQPTGKVLIPGPDPATLPTGSIGQHRILLRIEATNETEGRSVVNDRFVSSGGVAGFPLPTFRYTIVPKSDRIALLSPIANARLAPTPPLQFRWQGVSGTSGYKLEVREGQKSIFSALLGANTTSYTAPPWLKKIRGRVLSWQVTAIGTNGSAIESQSQNWQFNLQ